MPPGKDRTAVLHRTVGRVLSMMHCTFSCFASDNDHGSASIWFAANDIDSAIRRRWWWRRQGYWFRLGDGRPRSSGGSVPV